MFEFNIDSKKYNHVHFIGIGGISMSGLAEILLVENYKVSGSDSKESKVINRLKKLGANIYIGQSGANIKEDVDLVIYTDAISADNPELLEAKNNNIQTIDRATFLGELMKNYKESIAISGTHGKTTTTSMLSTIMNNGNVDPTILLGGQLKEIGGNVKLGSRNCILTEACEYKGNILKYFPTIAVIMNVDEDHLDYFKSMDHIINTFKEFADNLKENDYLIINNDDNSKDKIIKDTKANIITFGIDNDSDYQAKNIDFTNLNTNFDLYIKGNFVKNITVKTLGKHNVYNALASVTTAHIYGMKIDTIEENLRRYSGVERRLEFKGYYNHVKIIDDYAHHPTEIQVTLKALKKANLDNKGKIYCIFQPHTYTRTQKLFNSFTKSFKDADITIITDIYAARELDDGSIHSRDLANAIEGTETLYLQTFDQIKEYLISNVQPNDIVLTMGAGNINELGESLIDQTFSAV